MNLSSIIVSHVDLEIPYPKEGKPSFIPLPIRKNPQSEAAFQEFLGDFFTGARYEDIRVNISNHYRNESYTDQVARAIAVITDSSFTCNTRFIINKYLSENISVYAMDYAVLKDYTPFGEITKVLNASTHASDLLPTFSKPRLSYFDFFKCVANNSTLEAEVAVRAVAKTAPAYQKYLTNHAILGDPNYDGYEYKWYPARLDNCTDKTDGTCVWNLMKPQTALFLESPFSDNQGSDVETTSAICDFWAGIAQAIIAVDASESVGVTEQHGDEIEVVFSPEL